MVFFKRKEKVPTEPQRLDWRLLERGAIALYYKSSVLSADLGWFRQAKYVVHEMNGTAWDSPAAFHTDVQRALGFPDYYTKNLASWIDCLAELHVPDESGTVLVFRRFDVFANVMNAFNNVNYNAFIGNQLSPFFGTATSAGAPRRVELGFSLGF